ncbi:MAG TPA: HNH endonuclease signature motif containing protein [Dehalococcoidia bacterium]|jgi:hypothetical protein|nr:HNH endonuclease signature motif containing protein [Dehalococcoidia bacterium]
MEFAIPEPNSGCWLFIGGDNTYNGYGRLRINGKRYRAHRLSYELHVGPIPDGLVPDHTCRVRICINPAHIEIVTSVVNVMRGEGPAALNARKTKCVRGHALPPTTGAPRECRECRKSYVRPGKRGEQTTMDQETPKPDDQEEKPKDPEPAPETA